MYTYDNHTDVINQIEFLDDHILVSGGDDGLVNFAPLRAFFVDLVTYLKVEFGGLPADEVGERFGHRSSR